MSSNDSTQVSTVHDTVAILSQTREILNDDISTLNYNIFSHNQNQCMNQGRYMDQTALCADQTPSLTEQQFLQARRLQEVDMQHINNTSAQPGTIVPTKSDSDEILCLQLLSKILKCALH